MGPVVVLAVFCTVFILVAWMYFSRLSKTINNSTARSEISLDSLNRFSMEAAAVIAKTFDLTKDVGKEVKVVVVLVDKANALLSPMGAKQDETLELLKTLVAKG